MLNTADATVIADLAEQLPDGTLFPATPNYLEEPRGKWQGQAATVARPKSVEQLSQILAFCNTRRIGVVPYGGGTGLVGGQIMQTGSLPVLVSLERLNQITQVFPSENVMVVQAGAILENIQSTAADHNRVFPLSLASQGSAQIGGNLATNAGGVNVLRYGNARDLCLGVQAVLADGSVYDGLTRLRKDNTGYDLRNLLIGSEGTLGIITAAALKLFPQPASIGTALLAVTNPQTAVDLLALARDIAGEGVSAFELMSRMGVTFLNETMPDFPIPMDPCPDWMVLVEFGLGADANAALTQLFEHAYDQGLVQDGIIASSQSQRASLWNLRETIPTANRLIGSISSHDISLPISTVPEFIETAPEHIAKLGQFRINCFGHLGDGNLHYNVFPPQGRDKADFANIATEVQSVVHDLVMQYDGSFSAEHGVGRLKTADLKRYANPTKLTMMRAIKSALDPNGILNPGVIFSGD
jgi:FAD/FMN-containing dehydrogenase